MQLYRYGALPTDKAPEENFTGDVYISGYFQREAPSWLAGATVTFSPGARTPWKVNPCGQTLIVLSGVGWAQGEGGERASRFVPTTFFGVRPGAGIGKVPRPTRR